MLTGNIQFVDCLCWMCRGRVGVFCLTEIGSLRVLACFGRRCQTSNATVFAVGVGVGYGRPGAFRNLWFCCRCRLGCGRPGDFTCFAVVVSCGVVGQERTISLFCCRCRSGCGACRPGALRHRVHSQNNQNAEEERIQREEGRRDWRRFVRSSACLSDTLCVANVDFMEPIE